MIGHILPAGVRSAEAFADVPNAQDALFPEEREQIGRAVEKRRREYATVRACARDALGGLGLRASALPKGDKGAPRWPRGVVGSMTHTDGYRAAAVAFSMQVRSVGIDAETDGPLPDGVLSTVSLPGERERLARAPRAAVHWDRLLFSAKESTYKAWYPLTGRWLGFEDADITCTFDPAAAGGADAGGRFRSRILVPGHTHAGAPLAELDGRWVAAGGLVVTAVVVV